MLKKCCKTKALSDSNIRLTSMQPFHTYMDKRTRMLAPAYGWLKALMISMKIRMNRDGQLSLPDLPHPVFFRSRSIDAYTIADVFGQRAYDIDLPFQPRFIIDGGANIGLSSVFFAHKYPEARILAIEPESSNYAILQKNAQAYRGITPLQTAIWSHNCHLVVKDKGYGLRGFMVEEAEKDAPQAFPARSIESLMEGKMEVDILKLDIEGSEKFVFSSNVEPWLPKVKCLIIELHDRMEEGCTEAVEQALARYQFTCSTKGENRIYLNKALT